MGILPWDRATKSGRSGPWGQARRVGGAPAAPASRCRLKAINAACLEVLKEARSDKKHVLSLRAVDRIARQIELQAKLLGDINDGATVNIAILPEWHGIRNAVLEALRPYPEARLAVGRALGSAGV